LVIREDSIFHCFKFLPLKEEGEIPGAGLEFCLLVFMNMNDFDKWQWMEGICPMIEINWLNGSDVTAAAF
jgi:hypothetical protein